MWWYRHPSFAVTAGGSWFSRFPLVTALFIDPTHRLRSFGLSSAERERDKPPSTLRIGVRINRELTTKCWVGFIDWLGVACGIINNLCRNADNVSRSKGDTAYMVQT